MFNDPTRVPLQTGERHYYAIDTREMQFANDIEIAFASRPILLNSVVLGAFEATDCALIDLVSEKKGRVHLLFPRALVEFVCETLSGSDEPIAPASLPLVFELAFQSFLEGIEASLQTRFAVKRVRFDEDDILQSLRQTSPRAVQVHIEDENLSCPVVFLATSDLKSVFDDWVGQTGRMALPFSPHLSDFPLFAPINVTSVTVPHRFLANIEVGDVVKLPDEDVQPEVSGRLRVGDRLYAHGVIEKSDMFIVDTVAMSPVPPGRNDPANEGSTHLQNTKGVPIENAQLFTLDIEFGELRLTSAALEDLRVGDAFEVRGPVANKIALKAEGRVLARGELIQIGPARGVKINTVYKG